MSRTPLIRSRMRFRFLVSAIVCACLSACAPARFDLPGGRPDAYAALHPTYAEYCALTQIKKKQGFGADIRGEIGGHAVFYLNGACLTPGETYPVLQLCQPGQADGVGLSMNAHFRNAKWVAIPGHRFFFGGGLPDGAPVTRASYEAVKREAERLGIYDGIQFHGVVFGDKPESWTDRDWKYEVSIGTDYGISLARGRYCAQVPVTKPQLRRMIGFLNAQNVPYREGQRTFHWSVFNDNCIHLAHNALAAAGFWKPWPIERFLPVAIFDFPVPKNEFVNIMRRASDDWLPDPGAVYRDVPARSELLDYARLPTFPGALAYAQGPHQPNAVYDTDLKLIFYDDPITGSYQTRFDRIFSEPRYTDPGANRAHFAALAQKADASRKPLGWWLARQPYKNDPAGFTRVYDGYYQALAAID